MSSSLIFVPCSWSLVGDRDRHQEDDARPRPKGGIELVYQARPTPQTRGRRPRHRPVDRHHPQARRRLRRLRAGDPADRHRPDLGRLAGRRATPAGRTSRSAQTAQLYFYDWETNVIRQPADAKSPPATCTSPVLRRRQVRLPAAARVHRQNKCTTSGPRYYLFDSPDRTPGSRGRPRRKRPLPGVAAARRSRANSEILTVPAGHGRRPGCPRSPQHGRTTRQSDAPLLRAQGQPGALGHRHHDPKHDFDQFNQPIVTFEFTRQGTQGVL